MSNLTQTNRNDINGTLSSLREFYTNPTGANAQYAMTKPLKIKLFGMYAQSLRNFFA